MDIAISLYRQSREKMAEVSSALLSFGFQRLNGIFLCLGAILLIVGLQEVAHAFAEPNYNDTLIRNAVGQLFKLIEGAFGALIMVVAGIGAIVAASMGAYRLAVSMLVVAVGAFILRSLVSLFFGENFPGIADS